MTPDSPGIKSGLLKKNTDKMKMITYVLIFIRKLHKKVKQKLAYTKLSER